MGGVRVDIAKPRVAMLTRCALEAKARSTGRTIRAVAEEVLDRWAEEYAHEASILDELLRVEGLIGTVRDSSGLPK